MLAIKIAKIERGNPSMNKKRLIITSIISILLVSILMIGSTYSIFTISDVDEDTMYIQQET